MKTQSHIILVCIFFVSFHSSCKRYEEGPFFSLLSVEQRVRNQKYLISYTVNGIDSMQYLIDSVFHCSNFRFWFLSDCGETFLKNNASDDPSNSTCISYSTFCHPLSSFFNQHKNNFDFLFDFTYKGKEVYPLSLSNKLNGNRVGWKIIRLTMKEMWLMVENDDHYPNKIFEMKFVAER